MILLNKFILKNYYTYSSKRLTIGENPSRSLNYNIADTQIKIIINVYIKEKKVFIDKFIKDITYHSVSNKDKVETYLDYNFDALYFSTGDVRYGYTDLYLELHLHLYFERDILKCSAEYTDNGYGFYSETTLAKKSLCEYLSSKKIKLP